MSRRLPVRDLAYVAGVIETRGRIRRTETEKRATPQLVLSVHCKTVKVTERLAALTGVNSRTITSKVVTSLTRRGCIEHCPEAHEHVGVTMPTMGVWAVTGAAAATVLSNLLGHLSEVDDDHQRFIDEAIAALPGAKGRHAVQLSLNRLKGLGWKLPDELDDWLKALKEAEAAIIRRGVTRTAVEALHPTKEGR